MRAVAASQPGYSALDRLRRDARSKFGDALPVIAIGVFVLGLWAPFGFKTPGLVEEWTTIQRLDAGYRLFWIDENSPEPYPELVVRPLTMFPHALANALDPHSFLWYNLLLMLCFMGKGIFGYYTLTRLVPEHRLFAFFTALLFIIYPADTALFTVRAFSGHPSVLFMLAAVYFLLRYWDDGKGFGMLLASVSLAISLLLYETAFPLALAVPLLLVWKAKGITRRVIRVSAMWFIVPILLAARALILFASSEASLYQAQLLGARINLRALLDAVVLLYRRTLVASWVEAARDFETGGYLLPMLALAALVIGATVYLWRMDRRATESRRVYGFLVLCGLGIILLGFLPYLLSERHRFANWRTFYFSSFGAALCLAAVVYLLTRQNRRLFAAAMIGFLGLATAHAYQQHESFVRLSLYQQRLLGRIVEQSPQLEEAATIVIVDRTGLIGYEWFFPAYSPIEDALRYLYHDPGLTAIVCLPEGVPSNRQSRVALPCDFAPAALEVTTSDEEAGVLQLPYDRILVFDHSYEQGVVLARDLTAYTNADVETTRYAPGERMTPERTGETERFFTCWRVTDCTPPVIELLPNNRLWLDFDEPMIPGQGWNPPAQTLRDGTSFRVSLSPQPILYARLEPDTDYQMRFEVVDSTPSDVRDFVQVVVNQMPVQLTRENAGSRQFEALILKDAVQNPIDEIRFVFPAPSSDEPAPRLRMDWLAIEPVGRQSLRQ